MYQQVSIILFLAFTNSPLFSQGINCEEVLTKFFKDHFKIDQPKKNQAFLIEACYIYEYNTEVTLDSIETDTIFSEVVVANEYYRNKTEKTESYYDGKEVFLVNHDDAYPSIIKTNGNKFEELYRRGFESFIELDSFMKHGEINCLENDSLYIANIHFDGEIVFLTGGIDDLHFFIDKKSKKVLPRWVSTSCRLTSVIRKTILTYNITPLNAKVVKAQSARSFLFEKDGELKDEYNNYRILE